MLITRSTSNKKKTIFLQFNHSNVTIKGVQRSRMAGTLLWPTLNPNMSQVSRTYTRYQLKIIQLLCHIFFLELRWLVSSPFQQLYFVWSLIHVSFSINSLIVVSFLTLSKVAPQMLIKTGQKNRSFLKTPKAVVKDVFSQSHCCYGNLSCHENDNNVLINDWAVF